VIGDTVVTMPGLLKAGYEKWADRVWMRKKELGVWKEYTWKEGYEKARHFSLGLVSLGFFRVFIVHGHVKLTQSCNDFATMIP